MEALRWTSLLILIACGVNCGLIGLFDLDLAALLFGSDSTLARQLYIIVGLAAVLQGFRTERWTLFERGGHAAGRL